MQCTVNFEKMRQHSMLTVSVTFRKLTLKTLLHLFITFGEPVNKIVWVVPAKNTAKPGIFPKIGFYPLNSVPKGTLYSKECPHRNNIVSQNIKRFAKVIALDFLIDSICRK